MDQAFVTVLPYALGAAVSPMLLTLQVIILASGKHAKLRGWVYLAGVALTTIVLIFVFATILKNVTVSGSGPSPIARGVEITTALVLAALAVRSFLPAHQHGNEHGSKLNHWMTQGRLGGFFLVGIVAMMTNLSSIVIMIPGVHHVEEADLTTSASLVSYVVLLLFVLLPGLLPVAVASVFGSSADAFLERVNTFVTKHSRTITGFVCAAIALYLILSSLA